MKTYTIDFRSHFRHLWIIILFVILLPLGIYYMSIIKLGYYKQNEGFALGGVIFFVFVIPHLILHLNYYLKNKREIFQVDSSGTKCIYQKDNNKINFTTSNIDSFICIKSRPLAENRMHVLPWDVYNYAEIKLKNGQTIKISSLLVYELDKIIKFDNIKINKTLYAWIG